MVCSAHAECLTSVGYCLQGFRGKCLKLIRVLFISLLAYAPVCGAEPRVAEEYTLKAAYLYNFAKFVVWPAASWEGVDSINLCVYGSDPFGEALDKLRSRKAQSRQISINMLGEALPEPGQCHILFVGRDHSSDWPELQARLSAEPVLTVSDMDGFIAKGGMVGFVNLSQRIKFEINLAASKGAGLSISSFLLKLALNVRGSG